MKLLIVVLLCLLSLGSSAQETIRVMPVFFLPRDANPVDSNLGALADLLNQYIKVAQGQYYKMLGTTFRVVDQPIPRMIAAGIDGTYINYSGAGEAPDNAHMIVQEVLDWNHENRMTSPYIYLIIYISPEREGRKIIGGGRTFNGMPGSGGGFVLLESSVLINDKPYPFLSTLVHELGHAFGLPHVDCLGYDMKKDKSIMSYNRKHKSKGLNPGKLEPFLNPEELWMLSLNTPVFPQFTYWEESNNANDIELKNLDSCFQGPMTQYIGVFYQARGRGYEILLNDVKMNGPEAVFYTFSQAEKHCKSTSGTEANLKIECKYNGKTFFRNY